MVRMIVMNCYKSFIATFSTVFKRFCLCFKQQPQTVVIPAQAGIHATNLLFFTGCLIQSHLDYWRTNASPRLSKHTWIPACAGMTDFGFKSR